MGDEEKGQYEQCFSGEVLVQRAVRGRIDVFDLGGLVPEVMRDEEGVEISIVALYVAADDVASGVVGPRSDHREEDHHDNDGP